MIELEDYYLIDFENELRQPSFVSRHLPHWISKLKSLNVKEEFVAFNEWKTSTGVRRIFSFDIPTVDQKAFLEFWNNDEIKSRLIKTQPFIGSKYSKYRELITDLHTADQFKAIMRSCQVNSRGTKEKIDNLQSLINEGLVLVNAVEKSALRNLDKKPGYNNLIDQLRWKQRYKEIYDGYLSYCAASNASRIERPIPLDTLLKVASRNETAQSYDYEAYQVGEYESIRGAIKRALLKDNAQIDLVLSIRAKGDRRFKTIRSTNAELGQMILNTVTLKLDELAFFDEHYPRKITSKSFIKQTSESILKLVARRGISKASLSKNQVAFLGAIFVILNIGQPPDPKAKSGTPYWELLLKWAKKNAVLA